MKRAKQQRFNDRKPRMRRPAKAEDALPERAGDGQARPMRTLSLQELQQMGTVHIEEGRYYGRSVQVAGRMRGAYIEGGEMFAELQATGTKDDELLRILSEAPAFRLNVHVCGENCDGALTDPLLIHGKSLQEVDLKAQPWFTNLEAVGTPRGGPAPDELARLRELQEQAREGAPGGDKKEKKKDKKRRDKGEADGGEGRAAKTPKKKEEELDVGQKPLEVIYSHTGLDPIPERRKKVLRRAKKLGKAKKKKKKKESSSSKSSGSRSSSSSSGSTDDEDSGLFGEDTKLMKIWRRCPGALTAGAVREARHGLMTQAGTLWNLGQGEIPPLLTQYCRQQVLQPHSVSPAMSQELMTLAQAADFLLMGKVAAAADVVCQRIKSLETVAKGARWTTGRQLELVRFDQFSMSEGSEALGAAKRAREEEKLKTLLGRGTGAKGGDAGYGGKNRKGKSTGKGKADDGGKNRGGDYRAKDDGKNQGKK